MRAEELLRRYLEQRRELGETELVLDGLSVEDVLRLLGAARSAPASQGATDWRATLAAAGAGPSQAGGPGRPIAREPGAPAANTADSRHAPSATASPGAPGEEPPIGTAGSAADEPRPTPRVAPSTAPGGTTEPALPPAGIVVDADTTELFGGPMAHVESLEEIAGMVRGCTRCPLHQTATRGVPGEGNPRAAVMCVGEGPGATEDQTGRPFVGQAGQLLTKILAAVNLAREEVFITNVVKHRPPGNRTPLPNEVEACAPYLRRQIELIGPKIIIAFGAPAAQTLLNTKLGISKMRGAIHRYHGIPVIVTYHPAALLRNPAWKRPTWEDVQLARRILDRALA